MYDPYKTSGPGLKERFKRAALFAAAVLAFGIAVVLFALLANIPSGRDREKTRESEERAAALLRDVTVAVAGSGFTPRRVGAQELYVPSLSVLVSNATSRTIEDVELFAWFGGRVSFFCRAYARVFRLAPGETSDATLKCVEPTAFGTVVEGVHLWELSQPVRYGLSLRLKRITVQAAEGLLEAKIVNR